MNDTNLPDKKALAAAIEMEEKGHKFYMETATKADNKLAKEVFEYLAAEEQNHITAIKKFNAEFLKGAATRIEAIIDDIKKGKGTTAFDQLFKSLSKTVPTGGSDIDAYKFASDFERRGEAFYKKAESEAVDKNAKKLYGFLVGEEKKHFKIVESCLLYFDNPEEFFHQREKWHVEG